MGKAEEKVLAAVAEALRQQPAGLLTDLDGTISRIAAWPGAATVSPVCRACLAELCRRLRLVAVVSGRPAAAARDLVGVPGAVYVGNHGFELWQRGRATVLPAARPFVPLVEAALRELEYGLGILPGVSYENKGVTASVHYRLAADPEAARQAILGSLRRSPAAGQLRCTEGRMVVELRPPLAVDKDTAVSELLRERELRAAVYLGDDTTDVDAFRALHLWARETGGRALAVAVLSSEAPPAVVEEADLTLPGVGAVERLLSGLVETPW